jgi:DNA-binding Lrp family transcriptional regulator
VLTLARELGVARGTVQARLDRLTASGVVTGYGPDIDPAAIGYRVTGFVTLEITQGRMDDVVAHLAAIPQLVEAHMVTGAGDLLCRVVATDNDHLGAVLAHILEVPGIARTTTVLALAAVVPFRLGPALEAAVGGLP